jgi:hypothetical protein
VSGAVVLIAVAGGWILSAAGCEGVSKPGESRDYQTGVELEGFPVPETFVFDESRSYLFSPAALGGSFHPTWTGYYRGPGRPDDYVPFYIREMQVRGWKLRQVDPQPESSTKRLEFIQTAEAKGATIILSRLWDNALFGGYGCAIKAEVRTLGPEAFSVNENLARMERRTARLEEGSVGLESIGGGDDAPQAGAAESAENHFTPQRSHQLTPLPQGETAPKNRVLAASAQLEPIPEAPFDGADEDFDTATEGVGDTELDPDGGAE